MKLKRLDIHGFKSFYHRTTIAFDDGITAVVGPNGCGKSNVVDSIKWVMGEQGPKNLRGGAMEDVIFAGSERRGPMGIAEVQLTFVNDGSADVPARWVEVPELAIHRSIERSKGSDYRINSARCRLADIQELVAGTGVGSGPGGQRAYAIIEQGQIGRIVSAKADERRLLIEEAAGITRYRNRRRQAERKMAETRANSERLLDVLGEVETRLRSLRRQARKAERYQLYADEARGIALRRAVFDYRGEAEAHQAARAAVEQAASAADDAERALATATARHAQLGLAEKMADERAREAAEALANAEHAVQTAEQRLVLTDEQAADATTQVQAADEEKARVARRLVELAEEAEAAEKRVLSIGSAQADDSDVEARQAQRKVAERGLVEARATLEGLRRAETEEASRLARAEAEQGAVVRQVESLTASIAGARAEQTELEAEHARLGEQLAVVEAAATAAHAAVEAALAAQDEARAAQQASRDAVRHATSDERKAADAWAQADARRKALQELEDRREGLGEGTRLVLSATLPGVIGPVTAALEVSAELEAAVAAVLGERLTGVVVADAGAAAAAVGHLRAKGRGRATLIRADATDVHPEPPQAAGVVGVLAGAVSGDPMVVAALLGDALLVEDLDAALAVAPRWPGRVVTRDGAVVEGSRAVHGGAVGGDTAPLSRRRALKGLIATVESCRVARVQVGEVLEVAEAAVLGARAAAEEASAARHAAEVGRAEARKDRGRVMAEAERARSQLAQRQATVLRLAEQLEAATARGAEAARVLAAASAGRTDRQAALAQAEERVREAEGVRDAAVSALHGARAEASARQARRDAAEATVSRIARQQRELAESQARIDRTRLVADTRRRTLADARAGLEKAVAQARSDAGERAAALGTLRAAHAEADAALKESTAAVDAARAQRDQWREAHTEGRLAVQARRLRMEHLDAQITERFKRPLAEALEECAEAEAPSDADLERLVQLESLMDRMAPVNLAAIDECQEVEERADFLEAQRGDLEAALADLTAAIERIDQTSRRLFKETFDAVDEHFRVLFPRLFRGGSARLELTDPDDLLGTGIEMLVQPPGKKVQTVTLLSGGEKAMCAIALVFAVFHVKPSPFCLLDEVDAPLDDANIGRFNEVVREMAQRSQIVLITHNKRTMEIADVLYGVTMEESGISKLVSVRMQ